MSFPEPVVTVVTSASTSAVISPVAAEAVKVANVATVERFPKFTSPAPVTVIVLTAAKPVATLVETSKLAPAAIVKVSTFAASKVIVEASPVVVKFNVFKVVAGTVPSKSTVPLISSRVTFKVATEELTVIVALVAEFFNVKSVNALDVTEDLFYNHQQLQF